MNINVKLEPDLEKVLNEVKAMRFTRNSSQIVREALMYYSRFLFGNNGTYKYRDSGTYAPEKR